ncbi:hypothetical protein FFONT_0322 [Fervidicoccus fontis Kam940]|jgi:hypothetical protein|uniref:Thioredoxin n=2 Tax=Fervidicoccus fontis TaxID=683846 RepID=I0A005_FERFK|nr:hypothetical protein FFONT_0322 [Fervidicoccus fontis Kam940]
MFKKRVYINMSKPKKLILVSAEHHPYHKKWLQLSQEVAQTLGLDFELKLEDYVFAIEHGVTDELGMAGLPQLFVEMEDGRIAVVLSEVPLDSNYQPDFEKSKAEVIEKIKNIE